MTLRGKRMYEFLDRLINVALPRIRDFRGVNPKSFDGNGNYSMGLTEQLVFPEIDPDNQLLPHLLPLPVRDGLALVEGQGDGEEMEIRSGDERHGVPADVFRSLSHRLV